VKVQSGTIDLSCRSTWCNVQLLQCVTPNKLVL